MKAENSFKGKKVLVAGGAGFVGTNLILRLLKEGAKVRATVHKKKPQIENAKIEWVKADLTRVKDCERAVSGMEYVFMCAANTSGAAVIEKTPLAHVTPNVLMNTLMLDASYKADVNKFLFISSNTVYPPTDYPVREHEMMAGELFEKYFCVGWMKRFGEIACEMYATKIKDPMKTVVVRPANIYGEYDDFEWATSHVIPALVRKAVERHDPLEVWGDGTEIKDLIYVGDFVDGMLLAMQKLDSFDPVNIATGVPVSVNDALAAILAAAKYSKARVVHNTSKPTMIPKRLIDTAKAKKLLGFTARVSIEEGMRKTVTWYARNRK